MKKLKKLTRNFALSNSETLPFVFGNPNLKEFLKIFSKINNSGFRYENIKNLFFYKSGRVDLELKNDILLLPTKKKEMNKHD